MHNPARPANDQRSLVAGSRYHISWQMKVFTFTPIAKHANPLCSSVGVIVRVFTYLKLHYFDPVRMFKKTPSCWHIRAEKNWPFEKWPRPPDVGVSHATPRRLRDVLLLKQLLERLSHHPDGVRNVRRFVFAVNQLETQQACNAQKHNARAHAFACRRTRTHRAGS